MFKSLSDNGIYSADPADVFYRVCSTMIPLKSIEVLLFTSIKSELYLSLKSSTIHTVSCGICLCEATEGVILKLNISTRVFEE